MLPAPRRATWNFVLSASLVLAGCGDSTPAPKPDVEAVTAGGTAPGATAAKPEAPAAPQPGDPGYVRQVTSKQVPGLIKAAQAGNLDAVKSLLETGVDPNLPIQGGLTALHVACGEGKVDIVKALLEKGANPNAREEIGATPLHIVAAANGNVEIATALLDKGAEVDAKDKKDRTPLMAAASNGRVDVLDLLLQRKADPNYQTQPGGGTALMAAVVAQQQEAVATLLASGAKVNLLDSKQANALHYAAETGNRPITELLIANGADVLQKSEEGGTAFQRAAFKEHEELAKYLQDLEKAAGGTGGEVAPTPEKPALPPAGAPKKSGGKKKPQQPPATEPPK